MLSIIMPTYNKSDYLANTLKGFTHQTCHDYQLVIVDDGSTDNTANVIDRFSHQLPICYTRQENGGASKARNTALSKAEGDIIVFCDDDRMPSPGYIHSYREALQNDSKLAAIGWKDEILTFDHEQLPLSDKVTQVRQQMPGGNNSRSFFTDEELEHDYESLLKRLYHRTPYDNYSFVIEKYGTKLDGFHLGFGMATTGNVAYNRKGAPNVFFDMGFKGWGCEDIEFMYQLKLEGYRFICEPSAANYHQRHKINQEKRMTDLAGNMAYFCLKHPYGDVYSYWSSFQSPDRSYNYIAANETYKRFLALEPSDPLNLYWTHTLACWQQSQKQILEEGKGI